MRNWVSLLSCLGLQFPQKVITFIMLSKVAHVLSRNFSLFHLPSHRTARPPSVEAMRDGDVDGETSARCISTSNNDTWYSDTVDRKIQPFTIHHVMQHVDHVPCHGYTQVVYNFDINVQCKLVFRESIKTHDIINEWLFKYNSFTWNWDTCMQRSLLLTRGYKESVKARVNIDVTIGEL